jgi:hypothetical protein
MTCRLLGSWALERLSMSRPPRIAGDDLADDVLELAARLDGHAR